MRSPAATPCFASSAFIARLHNRVAAGHNGAAVAQALLRVAIRLASRTLLGAAEMVLATGAHPAALKDEVTTPAGCIIAGILALEDGKIRSTLARAVERAASCAAGLGKSK